RTGHPRSPQRAHFDDVASDLGWTKEPVARTVACHLRSLRKNERRLDIIQHSAAAQVFESPLATGKTLVDRGNVQNDSVASLHAMPMGESAGSGDLLVLQAPKHVDVVRSNFDGVDPFALDADLGIELNSPARRFSANRHCAREFARHGYGFFLGHGFQAN